MLADGFSVDPTRYSTVFCKFRNYISYVIYRIPSDFTLMATVDRYCCSSQSTKRRKFSTLQVSYYVIPIIIASVMLISSHILIYFQIDRRINICRPKEGRYTEFFGAFNLFMYILSLYVLVLFGFLTIVNVRKQQRRRIMPIRLSMASTHYKKRQREAQLYIILFFHVASYLFLALPFVLSLLFTAVVKKPTSTFLFIQNLSRILFNSWYSIQFYIFTMSARLYRYEFFSALNCLSQRFIGIKCIRTKNDEKSHNRSMRVTVLTAEYSA
ncbi:unnamed protein product [Didymodactylos carnosus]|uniref:G-protein coupled receptors family 1 profile domain-containing protein n=1 Tax=Didymodactylos carnosus TaxID=1234261 RepID=A0A814D547_9BILA|nr:unnamed protein product [Didymodactylos carnosus]CAF0967734.1 unnamed protein product [Didymodactylos carnosus]CAF3728903.1 unnamed protein product [Didymodactylos carnosus]CAF3739442.1 unnamed protein product [Didymodactylos carnosus]